MKYFVAGSTARTAAELAGIHRNTSIRFFHKLREKIATKQHSRSEPFCGKIELNESYFGGFARASEVVELQGKLLYLIY